MAIFHGHLHGQAAGMIRFEPTVNAELNLLGSSLEIPADAVRRVSPRHRGLVSLEMPVEVFLLAFGQLARQNATLCVCGDENEIATETTPVF